MKTQRRQIVKTLLAVVIASLMMFGGAAMAEKLVLPASLGQVAEDSFYGDRSLDEVELPDGMTAIGAKAFADSSVRRIYLPESLNDIAPDAFDGSANVVGYGMPDTYAAKYCEDHHIPYEPFTTPIGEFTFSYPNAIEATVTGWSGEGRYVVIPKMADADHEVTAIDDGVFTGKDFIRAVSLPSTVESIGAYAFKDCTGLTTLRLPAALEVIGHYAFNGCTGIVDVAFNDGLKEIHGRAFADCVKLKDADLPDSLELLDNYVNNPVFGNDVVLEHVHYPFNLKQSAWGGAFKNCPKLTEVTV